MVLLASGVPSWDGSSSFSSSFACGETCELASRSATVPLTALALVGCCWPGAEAAGADSPPAVVGCEESGRIAAGESQRCYRHQRPNQPAHVKPQSNES